MKNFKFFLCFVVFFVLASMIYAQEVTEKKDLTKIIIGKWEIAPTKRVKTGDITFTKDGKYDMNEKYLDGGGGGTKGEYKLDCDTSPATIKLCPGKCPGSEWTNRFGIIQIISDDKMEILTSPDSNYPKEFPEDKTSEYTMILTRIE